MEVECSCKEHVGATLAVLSQLLCDWMIVSLSPLFQYFGVRMGKVVAVVQWMAHRAAIFVIGNKKIV